MSRKSLLKSAGAVAAVLSVMWPPAVVAAPETLTLAPPSGPEVSSFARPLGAAHFLSHARKLERLRARIKYVFVLFQENRSFDHYFGTYPGANGVFPPGTTATHRPTNAEVPGFTQQIVNTDGTVGVITPFLIPQTVRGVSASGAPVDVPLYPADITSVDHSHAGIVNGIDVVAGTALNDRFVLNAEGFTTNATGQVVTRAGAPVGAATAPSLAAKQKGELLVAHVDCDTIPVLWRYADRFTLFDNFNMTIIGPSTPNAIAMIAGQSGETQWVLHPSQGSNNTADPIVAATGGEPMVGDPSPFPGSNSDHAKVKPPFGPHDTSPANPTFNQTYASLPLSFMGKTINATILSDQNPVLDLTDVQGDIATIARQDAVNWGWYQQGYDREPTDGAGPATYANYITHHNGPQYFGYVGDNPEALKRLHGLADFFDDVAAKRLKPGVFYVRGGYGNNDRLKPASPSPAVQMAFQGNDDHPGYADSEISGALLADEVNAIAASSYWQDSVIIITFDESDGLWDHQPPEIREYDPGGKPLAAGSRIPAILISPYGVAHAISHVRSEHSSVIKFIDELYGLTPLADLPVEADARARGQAMFGQPNLGPADDKVADIGDLFEAFDDRRLTGRIAPLPASYARLPAGDYLKFPQFGGKGCSALHIVPTDYVGGALIDPAPADFNPRGATNPGVPATTPGWPTN